MKFAIIDPRAKQLTFSNCTSKGEAVKVAGLKPGKTNESDLGGGMVIVVDEDGLFEPRERQAYFALDGRLYAGNAMLYSVALAGWLGDVLARIMWFDKAFDAEQAIERGEVTQPSMTVNGDVLWVWPQPLPKFMAAKMASDKGKKSDRV